MRTHVLLLIAGLVQMTGAFVAPTPSMPVTTAVTRTTGLECFAGGSSTPKKTAAKKVVKKVAKKVAPKKAAPKKVVKKVAPKKVVKKVAPKTAKQTGLAAVPGAKTTNDIFGGLFP